MRPEREYVNESQLRFEITAVNLKEDYLKERTADLEKRFNERLKERVIEVNEELKDPKKDHSHIRFLEDELKYLETLTIEKQNKERLGVMVLLIIKNLSKKPCFSGYSNNWKDEFYSRAVENVFKYIHNFDETKISKRTGARVNAFSYITQVVYTAFLMTINERKKEDEKKSHCVSLESGLDVDSKYNRRVSTFDFQYTLGIQKNIKEEFIKIMDKIQELEKVENERANLDTEIYCIKNNSSKESLMDPVFNTELQKMVSQLNDLVFRSLELKRYLNVDYVPKEIHLFVLKGIDERFKGDLLELCNTYNKTFISKEITKDEYNKLKGVNKKIPQKIVEDW